MKESCGRGRKKKRFVPSVGTGVAAGGSVGAEVAGAAVGVVVGASVGARVRGAACGRLGAAKWGKKKNGVTHKWPRARRVGVQISTARAGRAIAPLSSSSMKTLLWSCRRDVQGLSI